MADCDMLAAEDIRDYTNAFKKHDEDGDGVISKKELGLLMRSLGLNPTEQELQDLTSDAYVTVYGTINLDSFIMKMAHRQSISFHEMEQVFRAFDSDKDGFIDVIELRLMLTCLGDKLSEEDVEEFIQELDVDGDGWVSFADFVTLLKPTMPPSMTPIAVMGSGVKTK